MHLAAINGTENFYKQTGIGARRRVAGRTGGDQRGPRGRRAGHGGRRPRRCYQTPAVVPTPETVPLMLPDSLNPRYSYGGSKIVSELIAFNYGQDHYRQVQGFPAAQRVWAEHGLGSTSSRSSSCGALAAQDAGDGAFPIQGDGTETRSFCYVDDIVEGILTMYEKGGHREVYHIGSDEEVSDPRPGRRPSARSSASTWTSEPGELQAGGTKRRCPDISKMRALGLVARGRLSKTASSAPWRGAASTATTSPPTRRPDVALRSPGLRLPPGEKSKDPRALEHAPGQRQADPDQVGRIALDAVDEPAAETVEGERSCHPQWFAAGRDRPPRLHRLVCRNGLWCKPNRDSHRCTHGPVAQPRYAGPVYNSPRSGHFHCRPCGARRFGISGACHVVRRR